VTQKWKVTESSDLFEIHSHAICSQKCSFEVRVQRSGLLGFIKLSCKMSHNYERFAIEPSSMVDLLPCPVKYHLVKTCTFRGYKDNLLLPTSISRCGL